MQDHTVLFVDDEINILKALERLMRNEPIRVLTRMFLGTNATPGDPSRMFGIAEPGLG